MENFKRLSLTDLKVEIARLPRKKALIAKVAEAGELLVGGPHVQIRDILATTGGEGGEGCVWRGGWNGSQGIFRDC